jgi:E3 ubiquitin-protein ligase UHRF1
MFDFQQVNREMMGVIESLQRQAEEMEESSEESSAKSEESSDKSDENLKSDEEKEVPKPCDSSEKVSEETKENDVDPPQKRKKGADGKAVVNVEEHTDEAAVEN